MKYTCLLALTIFVLSTERCDALSLGSILGFGGNNTTSNEDDNGPTPTKISRFEKLLQTLMKPINAINGSGRGLNNIVSHLPASLRNPIESTISSGKRGLSDILNPLKNKIHAIYPGTNWCGAGDIAENEEDLGLFNSTDACCRAHDGCSSNINANEEKDGLLNNGIFTRSHCSCDQAFHDCLKDARSIVATNIGVTYFNLLSPQCFALDNPVVNCSEHSSSNLNEDKCKEYILNPNEEKRMQWFDNPGF